MLKDAPPAKYLIPNTKYLCGPTGDRENGQTGRRADGRTGQRDTGFL